MDYCNKLDKLVEDNNNYSKINFSLDNNYIFSLTGALEDNTNTNLSNKNNIDTRLDNISKLIYLQDWNKLHIINKKIKITEFLKELNLKNNFNINEIESEIFTRLENKQLNKKVVQYDSVNGKILDILCLAKDNNNNLILV